MHDFFAEMKTICIEHDCDWDDAVRLARRYIANDPVLRQRRDNRGHYQGILEAVVVSSTQEEISEILSYLKMSLS
jgi:hypothetical protein